MNKVSTEKTMTVKEVAEVLGVTPEAIKKHVRELFPECIRNGIETVLTVSQVTEIKKKMLPTTLVVGAVTEIDRQKTIMLAMQYLKEDYDKMKQRAEIAEQKFDNECQINIRINKSDEPLAKSKFDTLSIHSTIHVHFG